MLEAVAEEKILSSYEIKLNNFEGPLDLLLFLIQRNEMDIYDIPIAFITKQYLEYLELMELLDLEVAGEFILMAATLIRIKAQMLLPTSNGDENEEDPREELIQALLEYRKYKEGATILNQKEKEEENYFPRSDFSFIEKPPKEEYLIDATLFDLLVAFKSLWEKAPEKSSHRVTFSGVTLEERVDFIMSYLQKKDKVPFIELFSDNPIRLVMVVTFMAILELVRQKLIQIKQSAHFSEIWVISNNNFGGD